MIPDSIKGAIDRYVEHGTPPGSFTMSVLENNFIQAVCHAGLDVQPHLIDIAKYVYNYIPSGCWGSPEKVEAWMLEKRQKA